MLVIRTLIRRIDETGRGDRGATLVAVVGVFMVGFIVAVMVAGVSLFAIQQNGGSKKNLQAFTAAESGRDVAVSDLADDPAHCAPTGSSAGNPSYSYTIYPSTSATAPTTSAGLTAGCPGTSSTFVVIVATGYAAPGSTQSTTVTSAYKWVPTQVPHPGGLGYNGNGVAIQWSNYEGDLIIRAGGFTCQGTGSGSHVEGSVYVLGGNADLNNGCTIDGGLYVYHGNVSASRNLTVGGGIMAFGNVTASNNLTVGAGIAAGGNVSASNNLTVGSGILASGNVSITNSCTISAGGIKAGGTVTLSASGAFTSPPTMPRPTCTIAGDVTAAGTGESALAEFTDYDKFFGIPIPLTGKYPRVKVTGNVTTNGTWNSTNKWYVNGSDARTAGAQSEVPAVSLPAFPVAETELLARSQWVEIAQNTAPWEAQGFTKLILPSGACSNWLNWSIPAIPALDFNGTGGLKALLQSNDTQNLVLDATACTGGFDIVASTYKLGRDVAILVPTDVDVVAGVLGGLFGDGSAFQSTNSTIRNLYLVQTDRVPTDAGPTPTRTTGCSSDDISFAFGSSVDDTVHALLYSPCAVNLSFSGSIHGQLYAPKITLTAGLDFYCEPMGVQGIIDLTCGTQGTGVTTVAGVGKLGARAYQTEP